MKKGHLLLIEHFNGRTLMYTFSKVPWVSILAIHLKGKILQLSMICFSFQTFSCRLRSQRYYDKIHPHDQMFYRSTFWQIKTCLNLTNSHNQLRCKSSENANKKVFLNILTNCVNISLVQADDRTIIPLTMTGPG